MYQLIKRKTIEGNKQLVRLGLIPRNEEILTFGNLISKSPSDKIFAIKPSGLQYRSLKDSGAIIIDLEGNILEGDKRPSSDYPTHLELYKGFPSIGAIVHTHSPYATAFAQAGREIKCLGTTHADFFNGDIPVIDALEQLQVKKDYEANTGRAIVTKFNNRRINYSEVPGCLVLHHGPFAWGNDIQSALKNALALETVAKLAFHTLGINRETKNIPDYLLEKHFSRKHGPKAYYGQKP